MIDPRALTRAMANRFFVKQRDNQINLGVNETMGNILVTDDGSADTAWPNRLMFRFKRLGAQYPETLTAFFNEYGELRCIPAQGSTVPFRIFTRETSAHTAHNAGVPVLEVMDDRSSRTRKLAIHNDGTIESPSIGAKVVTVPAGTTGFASQPDGTLWIEYTP
jgi:hypothetical protein